MRSCDTCPGGGNCAADNLAPVLAEIYALYASGTTDKFAILFALSDGSEDLFERYNDQVSRVCWTRAALECIADQVVGRSYSGLDKSAYRQRVREILINAVSAFATFPWYVAGLIGQAPDLFEAIAHRDQQNVFSTFLSKRDFVKLCREVVYPD